MYAITQRGIQESYVSVTPFTRRVRPPAQAPQEDVGASRAAVWLPQGLAAILSFRSATGPQSRLIWSMLSAASDGVQEVIAGRVAVVVLRQELELYAGRELRGKRGLQHLHEACSVSTMSAPQTVLDGHRLFVDVIQVPDGSGRAAIGFVLGDAFVEHGATFNQAGVGVPAGIWAELSSYMAVEMAVRAAANVTGEKRRYVRTIAKDKVCDYIPGAAGMELGVFRKQFVERSLAQLKVREIEEKWLRWSARADKARNATKLVIEANVPDKLLRLEHPGPRPRILFKDQSDLNQLRNGDEAAAAVRRQKREAAAFAEMVSDDEEIG